MILWGLMVLPLPYAGQIDQTRGPVLVIGAFFLMWLGPYVTVQNDCFDMTAIWCYINNTELN